MEGLRVELNYMLYPGMPVVRKWITFRNEGSDDLKIEALNVEDLGTCLLSCDRAWFIIIMPG